MKTTMGIVGVPNTTITTFATQQEVADMEGSNLQREADGKKARPLERMAFDESRRRLATQGAVSVRYFAA